MARFQRFSTPTKVTLACGKVVTVISVCYVKHLWGYTGDQEFLIGGVTPDFKRVYFVA